MEDMVATISPLVNIAYGSCIIGICPEQYKNFMFITNDHIGKKAVSRWDMQWLLLLWLESLIEKYSKELTTKFILTPNAIKEISYHPFDKWTIIE